MSRDAMKSRDSLIMELHRLRAQLVLAKTSLKALRYNPKHVCNEKTCHHVENCSCKGHYIANDTLAKIEEMEKGGKG